jgi:hypothetical protein
LALDKFESAFFNSVVAEDLTVLAPARTFSADVSVALDLAVYYECERENEGTTAETNTFTNEKTRQEK